MQVLVEECGRLALGEAEVDGTKLEQLLERAQPPHRDRWIRSRREGDCDVARHPFEEEVERVMTTAIRDLVVVVEHDDELLADRFQVVEDSGDDRSDEIRSRLPERAQGCGAPVGYSVPDRLNDVAPERDRVVVPPVERHAGEGAAIDVPPLREKGRLSEPRRRGKQDEPRPRLAQHVGAAGTGESVPRSPNPLELPLEEDAVLGGSTGEPIGSCSGCGQGERRLISGRGRAISVAHDCPRGNGGLHGTSVLPASGVPAPPRRCTERRGPLAG